MTFCKVKVENIRGPMSVSLSGVSILKTISDGNGFRFYPDFSRDFPLISREFPEFSWEFPEFSREFPEISRDIPVFSRDIPVSLRRVSVFFRHFFSDPRAQVA